MRRLLVLVAAVSLFAGACGGDGDKENAETVGGDDATTTTVAGATPDENTDLKAKLLTIADLPAGYKVSEDDSDDDSGDEEDSSSSGCPALDEYDEKYSEAADADLEIDFEKGEVSDTGEFPADGLRFLNQSVERWSSDDKADESFDAAVAAFNKCKTFNADEDGSQISGEMSPLTFPKLEDDTFAVHIKFTVTDEGQTLTFDGDMVAVRSGKYVGLVMAMSFGGPAMPKADFEAIVRKAAAKL